MKVKKWFFALLWIVLSRSGLPGQSESLRNEKVVVREVNVLSGDQFPLPPDRAGVAIHLDAGMTEHIAQGGNPRSAAVQRGDTVFYKSGSGTLRNAGAKAFRIVWIEFTGKGSPESWGVTGLSPKYKPLFENQYVRAYDIRIAAGTSEPWHSHRDRVVVCLSGAEVVHEMPDGRKETSSLKTGEIGWRRGGTHIGHNLGKTDLWVIAVEPK